MPHKKGSPEAKAWAAKMRAAREANRDAARILENPPKIDQNNENALLKRIEELEQRLNLPVQQTPVSTVHTVIQHFSYNPKDYPDPRDRLFEEPRLKLKNFNRNWFELGWNVAKINYEQDGQKMVAPRFELELHKVIEDPETGEPTNRRWVVCRGLFFEDPESFIDIANRHGIEVPLVQQKDFFDEMRYLTMRDWLLEAFYPPKSTAKAGAKEMIVGNQLVNVFTVSSEDKLSTSDLMSKL